MKKILLASMLALLAFVTYSQTGVPGQISTSTVQVRSYGSGTPVTRPCMVWLPESYDDEGEELKQYPLLIFFHGHGERGIYTDVTGLRTYGPFYHLYNQTWDGTASYGVTTCQPTKFIVFAFQMYNDDFFHAEIDYAIDQLYNRFRIDRSRIIITGISGGGGTTHSYAMDANRSNKPRHMIPMSVPAADFTNVPTVAGNGMKVWAFADDVPNVGAFYTTTTSIVSAFNNAVSGSARFTGDGTSGHCCWNDYYDPSYTESDTYNGVTMNVNIYQWAMRRLGYTETTSEQNCLWGYPYRSLKFAGYVTGGHGTKVSACNASCYQPIWTTDGTIMGRVLYTSPIPTDVFTSSGSGWHYGYASSKLENAPADIDITVNEFGGVTHVENCIGLAGYVSSGSYGNPGAVCSQSCSTAVYSNANVVGPGLKLYNSDGITAFNGGWADYGFTPAQYGTAQKRLNIDGSGNILNIDNCPYVGTKQAAGYYTSVKTSVTAACGQTTSTQIYTDNGSISTGSIIYTNSTGSSFAANGHYGYSATANGSAADVSLIYNGAIIASASCSGPRARPGDPITESSNSAIRIFPNPAFHQLTIQLGTDIGSQVQLFNMNGVLLYNARTNGQTHIIPVSTLAKGVYLIRINNASGQQIESRKIIIQ